MHRMENASGIRIVMITDSLARGGKERRMLELIKGLCRNPAYAIKLICLTDNLEYEYVRSLPIEFEILPRQKKMDWKVIGKLAKSIASFSPHIIHSWGSMASVLLLPILLRNKYLFVNGIIADAPARLSRFSGSFLRKWITYPWSDRIISNSEAGIRAYRAPRRKTLCIYNGVDMARFSNLPSPLALLQALLPAWKEGLFVVGMVAAFESRKDYQTLIKAAIRILEDHPDFRFLLVGDGAHRNELQSRVPEDLRDKILFLGKRSDVEAVVQVLDVGVLLTNASVHGEGISNSIIEYMALGKPVLATRGGGTNEIVRDGENGFLLDPADESQFIQRLLELKSDPVRSREMGRKGREWINNSFNLEKMTRSYEEVYQKLFNRKTKA